MDDALFHHSGKEGLAVRPHPAGAKEKRPATAAEVQFIIIDGSKVTDKGFRRRPRLREHPVAACGERRPHRRVAQEDGRLQKLDYLALEKAKVTAAGLEAVAAARSSTSPWNPVDLTEDAFKAIGKMQNWSNCGSPTRSSRASGCRTSSALPKLKELNLMRCDIDDAAVKHLTAMPALEDVTLNDTKLTDAGFAELLKRPLLQKLWVDGTKVDEKRCTRRRRRTTRSAGSYYYATTSDRPNETPRDDRPWAFALRIRSSPPTEPAHAPPRPCSRSSSPSPVAARKTPRRGMLWTTPADEDPEVIAHCKAKGWSLMRDIRISDGKRLVFLSVRGGKLFEDVSLTPDDYKMIAKAKTVQVLALGSVKVADDDRRPSPVCRTSKASS